MSKNDKTQNEGISTDTLYWLDLVIGHFDRCVVQSSSGSTQDEWRTKNDKALNEVISELEKRRTH